MKPYLKYVFELSFRKKLLINLVFLMMVIDIASRLAIPYMMKFIVDALTVGVTNGFSDDVVRLILFCGGGWFVFSILNILANTYYNYNIWQLRNFAASQSREQLFNRLLKLDYSKHTQNASDFYVNVFFDAESACWTMCSDWFRRIIPTVLGFLVMLTLAFSVDWRLTLMSLLLMFFGILQIVFIGMRTVKKQKAVNKMYRTYFEHVLDQISNIITYKLNQNLGYYTSKGGELIEKATLKQLEVNNYWMISRILNFQNICRVSVLCFGIYLIYAGQSSIGTLFMFMGLVSEINAPVDMLWDVLPEYAKNQKHIETFLKIIDEPDKVVDPKRPKKLDVSAAASKIEFKNVVFAYDSNKRHNTLNDVSFKIEPGEKVALVGMSGAGKSTVMGILTRLFDPVGGKVLLDGVDIREFKQEDYRKLFGVVLQDHSLYDETVLENIKYGKLNATREEVIEAAKLADADEFISKLVNGYDTLVGERGVRLSGGEKQRISIARAFLKNPKIVVLDEPTSALDSITEAKVQQGLKELLKGRSALIIAHRLATVKNVDKIFVMKHGEIIAKGSHNYLMRNCKDYQKMVDLQTGGFKEY